MAANEKEVLKRIAEAKKTKSGSLDLSGLGIKTFPYELFELAPQLTQLDIRFNQIGDNSAINIAQNLKQLTRLDISENKIGENGAINIAQNLKQLTRLDIRLNQIGENGAMSIAQNLKQLTQLDIRNNQIGDNGAMSIAQNLKQLTQLDISENQIGDNGAMSIAQNLKQLTQLDISENQIGENGAMSIAQNLKQLTQLDISLNKIGENGAMSIAQNLKQLTQLDISYNQIGENGAISIAQNLKQLTQLDIRYNKIGENGAISIAQNLNQLTQLDISYNKIGENGAISIAQNLKQLTQLDIRDNQIGDNGIKAIHDAYKDNTNIYIRLEYNNTKEIHRTALYRWENLKQYFSTIAPSEETVTVNALNILFLGNTTAGKSSLLNYYLDQTNDPLTKEADRTFGIIHINDRKEIEGQEVDMSLWDFGGQEYFHGTHRLFFGIKNALYLVLWESVNEEAEKETTLFPFRYWLGAVQHFNEVFRKDRKEVYQRTLLIQSKTDKEENKLLSIPDIYTDENNRFTLPHDNICNVSVKKAFKQERKYQQQWELFKIRFEDLILKHKSNYKFNKKIKDIKDEHLPEWRKERLLYINKNNFVERCKQYYDKAEENQDLILDYFEDSGEILRFQFPDLEDMIFIDPKGLLNSIYTVLGEEVHNKSGGYFKKRDIKSDKFKGADIDIVLEIMQVMELIFIDPRTEEEPEEEKVYVAPQYMKEDNASAMLDHIRVLLKPSFTLRYPDFMPRAYITQFISRKGHQSINGVFWKFGVLYKYDESENCTRVLVEADPNNRYVHVYADGTKDKYKAIKEVFEFFALYEQTKKKEELALKENNNEKEGDIEHKEQKITIDYTPVEHLELSADGVNFATIKELLIATEKRVIKVKSTTDDYMHVDSIFHVLLNKNDTMPKKIFFSYAHADKKYRDEFEKHFASLKREGLVETWNDALIPIGGDWDATIKKQLNEADIVLYMLSPSFLASEYIWENEIKKLEEDKGTGIFIPIFVSPCEFEHMSVGAKQGAPVTEHTDNDTGKPALSPAWVALHDNPAKRDELYLQVVKKIRQRIKSL